MEKIILCNLTHSKSLTKDNDSPVKNVTRILSSLFDGGSVENETEFDGNPIIFLANAMEIP